MTDTKDMQKLVAEFLEAAKPSLLLEKFSVDSTWIKRCKFKTIVKTGEIHYGKELECEDLSADGLREFADMIDAISVGLGEPDVFTGDDGGLFVHWDLSSPATPEELSDAAQWLKDNPDPNEDGLIQWRPLVPFTLYKVINKIDGTE